MHLSRSSPLEEPCCKAQLAVTLAKHTSLTCCVWPNSGALADVAGCPKREGVLEDCPKRPPVENRPPEVVAGVWAPKREGVEAAPEMQRIGLLSLAEQYSLVSIDNQMELVVQRRCKNTHQMTAGVGRRRALAAWRLSIVQLPK